MGSLKVNTYIPVNRTSVLLTLDQAAVLIDLTPLNQERNKLLLDFSELGLTDLIPFTNSRFNFHINKLTVVIFFFFTYIGLIPHQFSPTN